MKITLLLLMVFSASCSSNKPNPDYINSIAYQSRAPIQDSFFKPHEKNFSEKEVKSLLHKKLNIPGGIKIAVIKLGSESFAVSKENAGYMGQISGATKRIKDISLVPKMLMPKEATLQNLRDVGAMMQANLVLILKTKSHTDWKFHFLKPNEAKSIVTVEAMAIDVTTGVIPFSTVATNHSKLKMDRDFSNNELSSRATLTAEDKCLKEVFSNVGTYFNEMK